MTDEKGSGDSGPGNGAIELSRYWRGSPELLAHTMRVLQNVTSGKSPPEPATLSIDVQVGDDHECFASADCFVQKISLEALRNFHSIHIESSGHLGQACLIIRWLRSRWAFAVIPDAVITLHVAGEDQNWAQSARQTIMDAIGRGYGGRFSVGYLQNFIFFLIGLFGAALWMVLVFLFPVLRVNLIELQFSQSLTIVLSYVAGYFLVEWAFPSLEIIPEGGSNAWRLMKKIGPVIVTILLAALTKYLFPSAPK